MQQLAQGRAELIPKAVRHPLDAAGRRRGLRGSGALSDSVSCAISSTSGEPRKTMRPVLSLTLNSASCLKALAACAGGAVAGCRGSLAPLIAPIMAARTVPSTFSANVHAGTDIRACENNPGTCAPSPYTVRHCWRRSPVRDHGGCPSWITASMTPQGLDMLDVMIARAEAACERGRKRLEAYRGPPGLMHRAKQQAMEADVGPTAGAEESGGGDPIERAGVGSSNHEFSVDSGRWGGGRCGGRPGRFHVLGRAAICGGFLGFARRGRPLQLEQRGYGQSWCLVSSGGLVLGLLNGFAVAEVHALDHLGETLRAVQPAPVPLGRLGELEDHGERGLA